MENAGYRGQRESAITKVVEVKRGSKDSTRQECRDGKSMEDKISLHSMLISTGKSHVVATVYLCSSVLSEESWKA